MTEAATPVGLDAAWGQVRERLRRSMTSSSFELWIEPLRAVAVSDAALVLEAPERVAAWASRRYGPQILALASELIAPVSELTFADHDTANATDEEPGSASSRGEPPPRHLFERFVIGRQNRLAHAAALAVAELPGEAYNPLFIHGEPGLGKSHLLGAITAYLRRTRPELEVRLTTAERFTQEFVTALRSSGPEAFKRRYRSLDALLIDDVQFLEGKQRTEEEFVHTFNELYAAGAQIVLSSDRPPEAMERLAQRLRDRFAWGLCVEIEPPDLRTRIAVVGRLVEESVRTSVDASVIRDLAVSAPANLRRLEGTVTRAIARSSLVGAPLAPEPDAAGAGPVVGSRRGRDRREPSLEAIQDAVGSVLGVSRAELVSRARSRHVSRARRTAMYLARELTSLSLAEISRGFDRDHSTVLHALRRAEAGVDDPREVENVARIRRLLVDDEAGSRGSVHSDEDPPRP